MGEARRNRELLPLAQTSCDIILPGTERELLRATGAHAARQRSVLARALSDLVLGQGSCSACEGGFEALDDLGCVIVVYTFAHGRELPTSPSFTICQTCLSTTKPIEWADRMVKAFMQKQKPRLVKS